MKKTKKENNMIKKLIILLFILILIIGVILIVFLKKNKKEVAINDTDPNGDLITIIDENNADNMQFIDLDDKDDENKNIKYEPLTYYSYYTNSRDNKTFRIQDVIHNNNNTITLKGRVYEYIELPEKLSAKEYQAVLNGKSLNIIGERATKLEDDKKAQEAGYELALKIDNKRIKNECLYYVTKNADGTANLYRGSEASVAEGTDKYLEINLSGNFTCYLFDEKIELKDYFKKDVHIANKNKTRLLHENTEFIFEQEGEGELIRIVFNTY